MAVARIYPLGDSGLYYIHVVEGHIDHDLPGHGRPDNSLPGQRPNRPDQGLPGYGRPDNSLPGMGGRPDNTLPGGAPKPGIPGVPDNSLPTTPPPTVAPGKVLVMIRGADGKWKWAALDEGYKPETLPEVPEVTPT